MNRYVENESNIGNCDPFPQSKYLYGRCIDIAVRGGIISLLPLGFSPSLPSKCAFILNTHYYNKYS